MSRGLKLSDDADLGLADDVASIGPEARTEIERSNLIPAVLSAARCDDLDERRVSVASVLSRLEAADWRIIEPGERHETPLHDTREKRKVTQEDRGKIVSAWLVNVFEKTWVPGERALRNGKLGWNFDNVSPPVPMNEEALTNMPPQMFEDVRPMVALTSLGVWLWLGRGRAKSRLPPARSFRPSGAGEVGPTAPWGVVGRGCPEPMVRPTGVNGVIWLARNP